MSSARTTPPMGWNSWDCYGTTVTEAEVIANAEFMAQHLLPYGWDTVVVDIDWSDPTAKSHGYNDAAPLAMDEYGRLIPDAGRFPSSRDGAGFGPLAQRVHDLGLRFGIHTMRGIPRRAVEADLPILSAGARASEVADRANACAWNPDMHGLDHENPAAQAYYDSLFALYASWGVDFIKADDMLRPYQTADIEAYARSIDGCGRDMELSLSPGVALSLARQDHLRRHATMWRLSDDVWDRWEDVESSFARFARWAPSAGPEGWPDGDMLPLGRIGIRAERGEPRDDLLTPAERISMMSLWLMGRSPLMIGGDLPSSDPATIALFQNADALALLRSTRRGEVLREDGIVLWTATGDDGARYAAAFNLEDHPRSVALDPRDIGLPADPAGGLMELWSGEAVQVSPEPAEGIVPGTPAIHRELAPHGAALLRWRA